MHYNALKIFYYRLSDISIAYLLLLVSARSLPYTIYFINLATYEAVEGKQSSQHEKLLRLFKMRF